ARHVPMPDIHVRGAPFEFTPYQRKVRVVDFIRSVVNRMGKTVMHVDGQTAGKPLLERRGRAVVVAVTHSRIQIDVPELWVQTALLQGNCTSWVDGARVGLIEGTAPDQRRTFIGDLRHPIAGKLL